MNGSDKKLSRDEVKYLREKEKRANKSKRDAERERIKKETAAQKNAERELREMERKAAERESARLRIEREKAREAERKRRTELADLRRKRRIAFYDKIKKKLVNKPDGFDYKSGGFMPKMKIVCAGDGATVLSALAAAGIRVYDFDGKAGETAFKIRKKDLRKAVAILGDLCYNYRIDDRYGIGKLCAFWLARIGLLLGAAASVVCLNLSYGYVWRISISGNDKLTDEAIERALYAAGVCAGRRKSDLRMADVAAALNSLDGVSDAAAEIVGTTLCVYVLESKDFFVAQKYSSYVSAFDATVTRIVARSGYSKVVRGATVKKGDVLVDGEVYSTTGELLYVAECDAEVYGDVSVTFSAEVSDAAVEYRRTGRSKTCTVFELFGIEIGTCKSPYVSYESVAHTARYDTFLPLYVTKTDFFETKPFDTERDIDEAAKEFAAEKIEEMRFVGDFRSSYTVKRSVSGLYSVHVFLSGEALISRGVTGV